MSWDAVNLLGDSLSLYILIYYLFGGIGAVPSLKLIILHCRGEFPSTVYYEFAQSARSEQALFQPLCEGGALFPLIILDGSFPRPG